VHGRQGITMTLTKEVPHKNLNFSRNQRNWTIIQRDSLQPSRYKTPTASKTKTIVKVFKSPNGTTDGKLKQIINLPKTVNIKKEIAVEEATYAYALPDLA